MKRKEKFYTEEQKEVFKFFKILFGLVVIIGLLYLFTVKFVNKENNYKRTNNSGKVQYESIYLGTLLNKADNEYYVLIVDNSDISNNLYISRVSEYKSKISHLPVFTADLSNELNKSFISKESSYNKDNMDNFKVSGTTLVKVKDGKIQKFIENKDSILSELK